MARPKKVVEGQEIDLVKMTRPDTHPEPHEVEVHPDMVDDYRKGGFVPAED